MDLTLERDDDPQTLDFVAAHNRLTDERLRTPAYERDRDAIQALIERDDLLAVPSRRGDWLFHFHRSGDNPLGLWRRLPADQLPLPDAAWEPVFDLDAFCAAEGERWLYNGVLTCPDEPTRVLLLLSKGGSDLTRLLEFDAERKMIVEGGFDLPAVRAHATWLSRDEICYFGSIDRFSATSSGWPRVGRRLKRGMRPDDAPVMFAAEDGDVYGLCQVAAPRSGDGDGPARAVTLFTRGLAIGKQLVHVAGDDGTLAPLPLPAEIDCSFNSRFCAWRAKDDTVVPSGSLVLQAFTPFADAPLGQRRIIFTPQPGQTVWQFALLDRFLAFVVRDRLQPSLYLMDLSQGIDAPVVQVAIPEALQNFHFVSQYGDIRRGTDDLYLVGYGFLQPPTLYSLALSASGVSAEPKEIARQPALFDATGMTSELLEAISADGTRVPYHIVLPRERPAGEIPTLLYGYGGFGAPLGPYYSAVNGVWLSQGGAYVQAYIRGGGEFGPDWHTVAKREGRVKAFEDFVAVARDLVARGYTRPERIACNGGSNGGLLTAVMLTRYPRDFGAVWSAVPVIDMTRFHTFPAGMAWVDEYGDPDNADDRAFLTAYSPLHQIKPAAELAYPPAYVESSSNDDRVHPSHARRFAAALEAAGQPVLFREYGSGGHGGGGNSREQAERRATGYSFLRETIMT